MRNEERAFFGIKSNGDLDWNRMYSDDRKLQYYGPFIYLPLSAAPHPAAPHPAEAAPGQPWGQTRVPLSLVLHELVQPGSELVQHSVHV